MAKEIFLASLQSLFSEPKYSDFTITCNDRKWNVHKLVLCTQSSFFSKACDGAFQEAESGEVDLKDDPDVVNAMIYFFYTFEYDDTEVPDNERMPFAVRTFIIADNYDIEPLKEQAANRFRVLTRDAPCGNGFSRAVKLMYENTLDTGTHESDLRSNAVKFAFNVRHVSSSSICRHDTRCTIRKFGCVRIAVIKALTGGK
ncbi:MAG: hypothetical protein Q9165_007221 [Trypethelium subeluteriae]